MCSVYLAANFWIWETRSLASVLACMCGERACPVTRVVFWQATHPRVLQHTSLMITGDWAIFSDLNAEYAAHFVFSHPLQLLPGICLTLLSPASLPFVTQTCGHIRSGHIADTLSFPPLQWMPSFLSRREFSLSILCRVRHTRLDTYLVRVFCLNFSTSNPSGRLELAKSTFLLALVTARFQLYNRPQGTSAYDRSSTRTFEWYMCCSAAGHPQRWF